MKYATFQEFIREARYHAADYVDLECEQPEDAPVPADIAIVALRHYITKQEDTKASNILQANFNWLRIPGAVTWLPSEDDVRRAYSIAHELQAADKGG